MLPPDKVVLELLEDTPYTPGLRKTCNELRRQGYRLALDDYSFGEADEALVDLVDIVKLDLQAMDGTIPASCVDALRGRGVELLAEKVETWDQFRACREQGCEFFQGYFFARPEVLTAGDLQPSQLALLDALRLLAMDADLPEVETVLSHDTGLIYKILRYVNAAAFARVSEITSLHGAFVLLGRDRLKIWLILLLYATADKHPAVNVLLDSARFRSALMGVCARALGMEPAECSEAQVVGGFSLLGALLQRPIEDLIASLTLPERMSRALLDRAGPYGPLLALVEKMEGAWTPEVTELSVRLGLEPGRLGELQVAAMAEASELLRV